MNRMDGISAARERGRTHLLYFAQGKSNGVWGERSDVGVPHRSRSFCNVPSKLEIFCVSEVKKGVELHFCELFNLDFFTPIDNHLASRMPEKSFAKKKLTREEERELDVKIGFMEGVVRRDPGYVEALQILGDDYTRRGKFVAGLKVDEQLSQLRPSDPLVQYNLACSYSLTGNYNQAIAALEKALELGYRDFKWLAEDPDLGALRLHPLYKNIRAKVRRMQTQKP